MVLFVSIFFFFFFRFSNTTAGKIPTPISKKFLLLLHFFLFVCLFLWTLLLQRTVRHSQFDLVQDPKNFMALLGTGRESVIVKNWWSSFCHRVACEISEQEVVQRHCGSDVPLHLENMTPCGEWRTWTLPPGNHPTLAGQPAVSNHQSATPLWDVAQSWNVQNVDGVPPTTWQLVFFFFFFFFWWCGV